MKEKIQYLVSGVKSVSEFLGDAVDGFKDTSFVKAIEAALPWAGTLGEATAEALPPLKFFTKIAEDLLKETDPEKLGLTACTLTYQKAVEIAFSKVPTPAGEKQTISETRDQLREIGKWEEVDMGTFSLDAPLNHEFYEQAKLCLQVAAMKVGYTQVQIDEITEIVQENFSLSLVKLLSDGDTKDKFAPFTEYQDLKGADKKLPKKLIAQHANYQRWLYEKAPVLRVSPFALKHVYIENDCSQLTWEELNGRSQRTAQDNTSPFDEQNNRKPLLATVLDLIGSQSLSDIIIIQGVAGTGKSSFTLKLCDELLKRRLHPVRIRINDLRFDIHIKDALPQAVAFTGEGYHEPNPSNIGSRFLDETMFSEKGIGDYEHICKYVIILDGWDEISLSEEGFKKKVAQMLDQINEHFIKQKNPRVRVILTGRPTSDIGDTNSIREKSPFLTILKLRPEQLENYVGKLAAAVNSAEPLIEKTEQTESWTVPELSRFEPIFDKYRAAFSGQNKKNEGELDVLGLPLLTYLTVRLVAEWKGDLTPLIENTTTLYRHLVDLTCKEAGKGDVGGEDSGDQYKFFGDELRQLLQKTAHAITMSGGENISLRELASRLDVDDDQLDTKTTRLAKENKLSALMISFYFKGGHTHLGCEFAHKSFREYLFAEAVIEAVKEYGREQKKTPAPREFYWEDFSENRWEDSRFKLSRNLSKLFAPQWLSPEVIKHIHQLIAWEIERTVKPETEPRPGTATEPLNWEQWKQVRTGLADMWEWWGEGAHMRPQPFKKEGVTDLKPAYVNDLIKWDAPRDSRINTWGYARTTTMDAHIGEGLFHLCTFVHYYMAESEENIGEVIPREYQAIHEEDGKKYLLFKPSGDHPNYFRNYVSRINSAGWRFGFSFPAENFMRRVVLNDANLDDLDFYQCDFEKAFLNGTSLNYSDLILTDFDNADLSSAILLDANFSSADLTNADLTNASLNGADLNDAYLTNAILNGTNLNHSKVNRSIFSAQGIKDAIFEIIFFEGEKLSREAFFKVLEERQEESDY